MRALRTKSRLLFGVYFSRSILAATLATATTLTLFAQSSTQSSNRIDRVLRDAVNEKKLPGIAAIVAVEDHVIYQGASGRRDTIKNIPMTVDSIFRIASMTKPITSVAVMQLVESGRVKLDEPAATYLPELSHVQVLEGFDASTGKAKLRPPKTIPTVRQLLSHTSGFAYEFFDPELHGYVATGAVPSLFQGDDGGFLKAPLLFDPGSRWEYGISTDWLGKLVEKVSGQTLEGYFRQHIFQPLGMTDTFFDVSPEKQARVVAVHQRQEDGSFLELSAEPFKPVRFFSGGGGLYSTASDYLKFARMLLDGGKLGNKRILQSATVDQMSRNQIGDLMLVELRSSVPQFAKDPSRILRWTSLAWDLESTPSPSKAVVPAAPWRGLVSTTPFSGLTRPEKRAR